jgi:predicted nucleic acid-binding protein
VQYVLVAQTPQLLETARQLVERHPLRAYDAVQLASAVNARQSLFSSPTTITFLSADKQLLAAAQTEGFVTDNPNLH